jgi:hypothetical protein
MNHRSQNILASISTTIAGWRRDSFAPFFIVLLVWTFASLVAVAIIASIE